MKAKGKKVNSKLNSVVDGLVEYQPVEYECMVMLKPLLPEDVRGKTLDTLKNIITQFGGEYLSEEVWGKKHLAYDIKGHEEGYYIVYRVNLNPSKLADIKRGFNLVNDVLRHMFIRTSEL